MSSYQPYEDYGPCPPWLVPFGEEIHEAIRRPGILDRFREQIDRCFTERDAQTSRRQEWERQREDHKARIFASEARPDEQRPEAGWSDTHEAVSITGHARASDLRTRKEVTIRYRRLVPCCFPPGLRWEDRPLEPPALFPLAREEDFAVSFCVDGDQPLTLAGKYLIVAAMYDAVFKDRGLELIGPYRRLKPTGEISKDCALELRRKEYRDVVQELCRMPDTDDRLAALRIYVQDVLADLSNYSSTQVEADGQESSLSIPRRAQKAGEQYRQAASALGEDKPVDREAYDQLAKAYETAGETGELPIFSTWQRNLREYRKLTGTQKNTPRSGRAEEAASVRRSSDL